MTSIPIHSQLAKMLFDKIPNIVDVKEKRFGDVCRDGAVIKVLLEDGEWHRLIEPMAIRYRATAVLSGSEG